MLAPPAPPLVRRSSTYDIVLPSLWIREVGPDGRARAKKEQRPRSAVVEKSRAPPREQC